MGAFPGEDQKDVPPGIPEELQRDPGHHRFGPSQEVGNLGDVGNRNPRNPQVDRFADELGEGGGGMPHADVADFPQSV